MRQSAGLPLVLISTDSLKLPKPRFSFHANAKALAGQLAGTLTRESCAMSDSRARALRPGRHGHSQRSACPREGDI